MPSEANMFLHISQQNQNTQNNQQPVKPARQISEHNTATTTQPSSWERARAAEGVALKINRLML